MWLCIYLAYIYIYLYTYIYIYLCVCVLFIDSFFHLRLAQIIDVWLSLTQFSTFQGFSPKLVKEIPRPSVFWYAPGPFSCDFLQVMTAAEKATAQAPTWKLNWGYAVGKLPVINSITLDYGNGHQISCDNLSNTCLKLFIFTLSIFYLRVAISEHRVYITMFVVHQDWINAVGHGCSIFL